MLSFTTKNKESKKVYSLLLVEDDRMVSSLLKSSLEKSGYSVHQVTRVNQTASAIFKHQPDIVLVDHSSSHGDALALCHRVREHFSGPLMMLSNQASDLEHIAAIKAGVDDYLIKPISFSLLHARIEAVARRIPQESSIEPNHKIEVGDIAVYPMAQKCHVKGQGIRLSRFEFQLLLLLLSNAGKVLTRDQIYTLLLGREYNGLERTIDVRISTLRDKLASKGMQQAQIETVWGKGYVLNTLAA